MVNNSLIPLSIELGNSAGGGYRWASIRLGGVELFREMVLEPASENIVAVFAERLRPLLEDE